MRTVAALLVVSFLALGACGAGDDGDGFSAGRACRNVERLIAALDDADTARAVEELDRLTDHDEVAERVDIDELDDAVGDDDDTSPGRVEDAVGDLDCDLDLTNPPAVPGTDVPQTDPTDPAPASTVATTDPATTDPATTDPTSAPTGSVPPFTLPPAPTSPSDTTDVPSTTDPSPPPTDETVPPTTSDPAPPAELVTVDVDATDEGGLGPGTGSTIGEYVEQFGMGGSIAPEGRQVIESVYISHEFGEAPSRYESVTYLFTSELGRGDVLSRFRDTVSGLGDYDLIEQQSSYDISFRTQPTDLGDELANFDVTAFGKKAGIHRVEVVRSEYRAGVATQMRPVVAEAADAAIVTIEDLGWTITAFNYGATRGVDRPSVGLTFATRGDTLDAASERLADSLGTTEIDEEDDSRLITIGDSYWSLFDYGSGVDGSFNRY